MALFLQSAKVPNILLIVSEDNGPELGCYGDRYARTPNLDRLASQGLQFNRAYVPQAGCSQSRASFLTGLYLTNMVKLVWRPGIFASIERIRPTCHVN